jgi:hypothetical protein
MMATKKTTVQTVEEKLNSEAQDPELQTEQMSNEVESQPFQLIPPFKISNKAKGMAKAAGVDLNNVEAMAPRINDWAASVEDRLNTIISAIPNLPAQTIELLKAEAEKQRQAAMQQMQATGRTVPPQGGMGNIGSFLQMIAPFLGGGGGDSELNALAKKALMSQINMGTAITNAVVSKIIGKATTEVASVVTRGE